MIIFRRSNRVILRPLNLLDVPAMTQYANNPAVSVNLTLYRPMPESAQREFVERMCRNDTNDVVVAIEVEGAFIGSMGLHGIDHRHGIATTGSVLSPSHQGKGYAPEAKMLLLEYAFNTLNLRKVCSNVYSFNTHSLKYAHKCGYKEEGRLKAHHYAMGSYHDRVQLAVFREDFLPLWKEFAEVHKESLIV